MKIGGSSRTPKRSTRLQNMRQTATTAWSNARHAEHHNARYDPVNQSLRDQVPISLCTSQNSRATGAAPLYCELPMADKVCDPSSPCTRAARCPLPNTPVPSSGISHWKRACSRLGTHPSKEQVMTARFQQKLSFVQIPKSHIPSTHGAIHDCQ